MALILSRTDIQRCLEMTEAIEAMRIAFGALNAGQAQAPQRMVVGLSEQGIALLCLCHRYYKRWKSMPLA